MIDLNPVFLGNINERLGDTMLLGYMRVSKNDGSQLLDLQRDALLKFGVLPEHIYEDFASGENDSRQGLVTCLKALRIRSKITSRFGHFAPMAW